MSTLPASCSNLVRSGLAVAALLALGALALACGGGSDAPPAAEPAAAAPQPAAEQPTPTPTPPPDPAALLAETGQNLRQAQSFNFLVEHEAGSIYVSTVQAKATVAKGGWNAEQGAQMTVDAYLVSGPDTPPTDGTYVELGMIVTSDSYFVTDPLSGFWTKRPFNSISIPITELNSIMAASADSIENPTPRWRGGNRRPERLQDYRRRPRHGDGLAAAFPRGRSAGERGDLDGYRGADPPSSPHHRANRRIRRPRYRAQSVAERLQCVR